MNDEKKTNDDIEKDVENCTKVFTLSEFSRETGIRIELLRRFISKQTRQMRTEAWEMIYPTIKELIGETDDPRPRRVGPGYRRHPELVEMFSDQKVLLDVFNCLPSGTQQEILHQWGSLIQAAPSQYSSLTSDENKLMGLFLAMDEKTRDRELLAMVKKGRQYISTQR